MFSQLFKRNTVALALIALTLAGLYWVLFLNIKWIQQDMSVLLSQVETDLKRDETFRSIELILKDSQEDLATLESYFVSENGVVGFIESLETLAAENAIKVTIDFLGVEDSDGSLPPEKDIKETLRLRLTTEGGWAGTMQFLGLLETVPTKINLDRASLIYTPTSESALSFTPPKGAKPSLKQTWRGSFDFTVFKLKGNAKES